jgi:hypothetical protein
MRSKLANFTAILFTISAVAYGTSTLVIPPPAAPVASLSSAVPLQAGGYSQQGPLVGGLGSCHFNITGCPGAGTYTAYQEPCDHTTFIVGGTRYNSHEQYRVILNGPSGGYVVALANRFLDSTGFATWDGTVYANDGLYACSCNGNGTRLSLAGADFNCTGSASWGGLCNSAGGNVALTVSP